MKYKELIREHIFTDDRPFASCHASTLLVLDNDETVAAWFGGTREKNPDVAIWSSRRAGGCWSRPAKCSDIDNLAHWNPVLFRFPGGQLRLFYKAGITATNWHTRFVVSDDGGVSWSASQELVPGDCGGRGPVKNKPIALDNGVIVAPASIERADPDAEGKFLWEAFVDRSEDGGSTWSKSGLVPIDRERMVARQYINAMGVIQPTLWRSSPRHVHMLLRSTEGWIYRSDSADGGATWGTAYATGLPNNNSGIDLTQTADGSLHLVCNPVSGHRTKTPRTPLVVLRSTDNGATWGEPYVLEDEPGEYSYPAIVSAGDELHITYTWRRERIAYRRLKLQ